MVSWGARRAHRSISFFFFFENESRPSRRARRRESSGEGGRGSFLLDLTSAQSESERIMESLWFFSDESLPGDQGSKWAGRREFFFPHTRLVFSEKGDYGIWATPAHTHVDVTRHVSIWAQRHFDILGVTVHNLCLLYVMFVQKHITRQLPPTKQIGLGCTRDNIQ